MKHLFNGAKRCNGNPIARKQPVTYFRNTSLILFLLSALAFTGCKKEIGSSQEEARLLKTSPSVIETNVLNQYTGITGQTMWELQQARAHSSRYRNIKNALKDGYVDINVVSPNMGYHYMNVNLVDEIFDVTKPEILVYNKDHDGNFHLVAVEYAIPRDLPMPEGFTGSHDSWTGDSPFPFWLLHAWVWAYNPAGVFNPTNPDVHLH